LELLTKEDLTIKEIQDKTGYEIGIIGQYINQFNKARKIKKVGNKNITRRI